MITMTHQIIREDGKRTVVLSFSNNRTNEVLDLSYDATNDTFINGVHVSASGNTNIFQSLDDILSQPRRSPYIARCVELMRSINTIWEGVN